MKIKVITSNGPTT